VTIEMAAFNGMDSHATVFQKKYVSLPQLFELTGLTFINNPIA
jgi:hypothetical protein